MVRSVYFDAPADKEINETQQISCPYYKSEVGDQDDKC